MPKPKLTGWLILFVVWVVLTGVNGLNSLSSAETIWRPYMADYASLRGAVMALQFLTGAGIVAWFYTAWVIYQREPGTLRNALNGLLLGALLRLGGQWSIVLFGRLPGDILQHLMPQVVFGTALIVLVTSAWYFYLVRSKRAREIYASQPT